MFESFHDMLRFGAFYWKNGIKTSDFRDLLLEGAIFIVGTQNLPQMISFLWLSNVLCKYEMCATPAVSDFGVKTFEIVDFL